MGLGNMLEQVQKMQKEMAKLQEEAAKKTVEVTSGGGMVKVVANGKNEILSLTIEPEVIKSEDKQMLEDLVKAGVNEAISASQKMVAEEMNKITAGLGPLSSMLKGG